MILVGSVAASKAQTVLLASQLECHTLLNVRSHDHIVAVGVAGNRNHGDGIQYSVDQLFSFSLTLRQRKRDEYGFSLTVLCVSAIR